MTENLTPALAAAYVRAWMRSAERIRAEQATRELVAIRTCTPEWDAWMAHYRATGLAAIVRGLEYSGRHLVPTPWPPKGTPAPADARAA